ncbi:hypothetical protein [Leucobacter musarum]|uniref:hypothetical protein n=1 Tax=Leucobacter musarum TaxID=1930747 RepID=UPI0006A773EF|nr:hypothetical protein [Leucobacter musarum]
MRTDTAIEAGSLEATAILDYRAPVMRGITERAQVSATSGDPAAVLEAAHALIRTQTRAVYALSERTPASRTLARGYGSCSQRLAILEGVARSLGVATRVRALHVDRTFWYPRFPRVAFVLPKRILLVWPEFAINGWSAASELFGSIGCRGGGAFTNRGAETLFEAAGRCAVDWDGRSGGGEFDLSRYVRADFGYFAHRDDAFDALGETMGSPARWVIDPIMRRIAAE